MLNVLMMIKEEKPIPPASLNQFVAYFFKLGYSGFGGPVALVGYIYRDLVETNKWITEEEYKQGLALAQLSPGPLAAQLGIYLGYIHYGIAGATLTILAFILPSFFMVLGLGIAYKLYGGLPWMQAVFYGIGAAVIGIIFSSSIKLTVKTIGNFTIGSFRKQWLLWLFFAASAVFTFVKQSDAILIYLFAGFVTMFIKHPPSWSKTLINCILFGGIGFWEIKEGSLMKMAIFFSNAGTFIFGTGLAIVPFLHEGVVNEFKWLNERQFLDAVAVAMITPGPVIMTVGFIGYLVSGFPGACVCAFATFLPCYLITICSAPYFKKIANNNSIRAFVEGITAAILGSLLGAVILIALKNIVDFPTGFIAFSVAIILFYSKRVPEQLIILVAAILGICVKYFEN